MPQNSGSCDTYILHCWFDDWVEGCPLLLGMWTASIAPGALALGSLGP